jgi:hypothetical protein
MPFRSVAASVNDLQSTTSPNHLGQNDHHIPKHPDFIGENPVAISTAAL